MKRPVSSWAAICGFVALLTASCFDPPTYSPIPSIEFDNVIFKDDPDASNPDSLIVTVRFKDGDGDMGLAASEIGAPYNDKFYWKYNDGTPQGAYVTYKTRKLPGFDTLPAFVHPYNCINWEIATVNQKTDTFYFTLNPNHYNFFVDFLVKNPTGTGYTEFDWRLEFPYPNCGIPFDGRFPILSKDLSQKSPLDGTIRYGMASTGFLFLFSTKTLKLRINVQDRALNRSNTIESEPFTLQQIKKSG